MRAALLWTSLLFGAPLSAATDVVDPAGEADPEHVGLAEIAVRILDLSAPLLAAPDRDAFFTALDLALLQLDLSSIARETLHTADSRELERTFEAHRAEVILEFEATVSPAWRAELRAGITRAATLTQDLVTQPEFLQGLHMLTNEEAPTIQQLLGDRSRSLEQRRAVLQYFRGLLCAGALAAAADEGVCIRDELTQLIIPMWHESLQQLEAAMQTGSFPEPTARPTPHSSPLTALLLQFECRGGERLAMYLQSDPSLAPLLHELATQIPRYFAADDLEHLTLAPTWALDADTEEPGLLVAIVTSQDITAAEASLERFDREWWLGRSLQTATRVVVDIRFT